MIENIPIEGELNPEYLDQFFASPQTHFMVPVTSPKLQASDLIPSVQDNGEPMALAYEGELRAGNVITVYVYLRNTNESAWDSVSLRGELGKGLRYISDSTSYNGTSLFDVETNSPVLTSTGHFLPSILPKGKGCISFQAQIQNSVTSENSSIELSFILKRQKNVLSKLKASALLNNTPQFNQEGCFITVDSDDKVTPGQLLTYTLNLYNSGKAKATGVRLRVNELLHATYVQGSTAIGEDSILDEVTGGSLFNDHGLFLGVIPPDKNVEISFKANVDYPLDPDKVVIASSVISSDQTSNLEVQASIVKVFSSAKFLPGKGTFLSTSAPNVVKPNETILYTFHYQNAGDAHAYGTRIRLAIPPCLEYTPNTVDSTGSEEEIELLTGGVLLGTICAGERGNLSIPLRLRTPIENGTLLELKGFVSHQDGEELSLPVLTQTVKAKPFLADPTLTWLEVSPRGQVEPFTKLTYTFHFKNEGDAAHAYRVRARCKLPDTVSFIPETLYFNNSLILDEETISSFFSSPGFEIDQIAFGEENQIKFQVEVNTLDNETPIDVIGTLEADDSEFYTTLPVTSLVRGKPDFSESGANFVEVSTQNEVSPGELITYYVHFENRGPVHANQVSISAQEPANTRYVINKTKLNGMPVPDEDKNSALFSTNGLNLGPMKVGDRGSLAFQVRINAPLEKGSLVDGKVKITVDDTLEYFLTLPPLQVRSYPDFSTPETNFMEHFPETPVTPGQKITYVFYYKNSGTDNAQDVKLKATCPPGTVYVKDSTRLNGIPISDVDGTCPLFGEGLSVDEVKWNRSGNISFQVKVGDHTETGTVLETCGCIEWDNKIFQTNKVKNMVSSFVDFSNKKQNYIQMSPQGEIFPGAVLTYTLRYRNDGTVPANNVAMKLHLPQYVQYIANSTLVNGQPITDSHDKSLVLTSNGLVLGNVAASESGEISVRCAVNEPLDDGTEISATGKIEWDPEQVMILDEIRTTVRSSPYFNEKNFTFFEKIEPLADTEDVYTYLVNFKNTGTSHAYNVVFRGFLPSGYTYVLNSVYFNGHLLDEQQNNGSLFTSNGLFVKRIDAEEEGNFTFQIIEKAGGAFNGAPRITIEAQGMPAHELIER